MTRVKICGITRIKDAIACADARADFIGLVFAPSRRRIDVETASQIIHKINKLDKRPVIVGVFVNAPATSVNRIATYCRLDYVQISGDENWDYCKDVELPVIKVIHITGAHTSKNILCEIETGYKSRLKHKPVCLLDTGALDSYGGTGQAFDWSLAGEVASRYPVIIAGGLTAENVSRLIKTARPWGVDVSTGVETNSRKDINKIISFIKTVRMGQESVT